MQVGSGLTEHYLRESLSESALAEYKLGVQRRVLGDLHEDTATTMLWLREAHCHMKWYWEAETVLEKCLQEQKLCLAQTHQNI